MDTVELGRSGIKIAPLGAGVMSWGNHRPQSYGGADSPQAEAEALDTLIAAGVNLLDTAELYGNEARVGELVRDRPEVVLATKFAALPFRRRSSVLRALDRSLGRLGRASVDLYQVHWPPRFLRIPTVMRELAVGHGDGRISAIGVSNFDAGQVRLAHAELAAAGIPLASNQVEYSLLHRKPEVDGVLDTCRELGVTLIAYMPLAAGALTGKYVSGGGPGVVRRMMPYFRSANLDGVRRVTDMLGEIGKQYDARPAQVALRWLIQQGVVPIPGAKNAEQASANAGALRFSLEPAELEALDGATRAWRG